MQAMETLWILQATRRVLQDFYVKLRRYEKMGLERVNVTDYS
jgi:hypothetical protein